MGDGSSPWSVKKELPATPQPPGAQWVARLVLSSAKPLKGQVIRTSGSQGRDMVTQRDHAAENTIVSLLLASRPDDLMIQRELDAHLQNSRMTFFNQNSAIVVFFFLSGQPAGF